uniref:Uncharacterized protein n=1 Tax=Kalanchoe fedtschenkoi TaxID=63787 RepID=A0A7N0V370_KALFE
MDSEEDTDISDSEIEEYEDTSYEELKNGKHQVKLSDAAFTCPYCSKNKKKEFAYKDLLQHASSIGKGTSQKRSARDKANHLALMKYLEKDLVSVNGLPKSANVAEPPSGCDQDEGFVWPWVGVLVNIPRQWKDGRYVGRSGSQLRDQLTARGFNPTRVNCLWNYQGFSGSAIVEFRKDWPGLHNALSFEKAYEANRHGKKHWLDTANRDSDLYGWVARASDREGKDIVGDNLRTMGDIRTIADIIEEEARKQRRLVSNLNKVIEVKDMHLKEIQNKVSEATEALIKTVEERDRLYAHYNEELKKIQLSATEHSQKITKDHEKLKLQIEAQLRYTEEQREELKKREARNESETRKLKEETEMNKTKNNSLELASLEHKKADASVSKLAEDQKRQKEDLHKRIIQLERQINAKHDLEIEIARLKGKLNVDRELATDGDIEKIKKVEQMMQELRDKEEDLEHVESLTQDLIVKERKSNDEVQDARKELINGLKDLGLSGQKKIGVKRMGDLDSKPFHEALKRKWNEDEADERAMELCSLWQEYLKDPEWHPFKMVQVDGIHQEIIDEEDIKLKSLRKDLGEDVFIAVTTALKEINEYNPSGRYIITELWNYEEGRKAKLQEGVALLLKLWQTKREKFGVTN